eukprot:1233142-Prymnesium_polylepis.1
MSSVNVQCVSAMAFASSATPGDSYLQASTPRTPSDDLGPVPRWPHMAGDARTRGADTPRCAPTKETACSSALAPTLPDCITRSY